MSRKDFLGYLTHCSLCEVAVLSKSKQTVCPECLESVLTAPKRTDVPKQRYRKRRMTVLQGIAADDDYPLGEVRG